MLKIIDDDKEYFTPLFEVGALDRRERIGNYESLALVQVKNFKPKPSALQEEQIDPKVIEKLKAEGVSSHIIYHNVLETIVDGKCQHFTPKNEIST
jgi:hypothetical protein